MLSVLSTVRAAAGVFAGTNVDDLVVLTALFLAARGGGPPRVWEIWTGHAAGMTVLVAVSVVGAVGLLIVPQYWAGLLGLVPLSLGVYRLAMASRGRSVRRRPVAASGLISVAAVTIGNGGDNLSAYIPLFRTIGPRATVVMIVVFAVGVAVWCVAASWLGSHRKIVGIVERYGHWIVPAVYVTIGVAIIASSGAAGHLAAAW